MTEPQVRRTCRWSLFYAGKWYCKLPAVRHPGTEPPRPLDTDGCSEDCSDADIVTWKVDLYGGDNGPPVRVMEWDEET